MTDEERLAAEYAALNQKPAAPREVVEHIVLPQTDDLIELAKSAVPHLARKAIILASESNRLQEVLSVLKEVSDRAYGRPAQSLEVTGNQKLDITHNITQDDREIIQRYFQSKIQGAKE